jgi:hypothetical protein
VTVTGKSHRVFDIDVTVRDACSGRSALADEIGAFTAPNARALATVPTKARLIFGVM